MKKGSCLALGTDDGDTGCTRNSNFDRAGEPTSVEVLDEVFPSSVSVEGDCRCSVLSALGSPSLDDLKLWSPLVATCGIGI